MRSLRCGAQSWQRRIVKRAPCLRQRQTTPAVVDGPAYQGPAPRPRSVPSIFEPPGAMMVPRTAPFIPPTIRPWCHRRVGVVAVVRTPVNAIVSAQTSRSVAAIVTSVLPCRIPSCNRTFSHLSAPAYSSDCSLDFPLYTHMFQLLILRRKIPSVVRGALTAERHDRLSLLLPRHALLAQPQDLVARIEPRLDKRARRKAQANHCYDECHERPGFSRPRS